MTCGDFVPPARDTLYIGLDGTAVFTYGDMIDTVGADQAPTDEVELETLLWSFDAQELSGSDGQQR